MVELGKIVDDQGELDFGQDHRIDPFGAGVDSAADRLGPPGASLFGIGNNRRAGWRQFFDRMAEPGWQTAPDRHAPASIGPARGQPPRPTGESPTTFWVFPHAALRHRPMAEPGGICNPDMTSGSSRTGAVALPVRIAGPAEATAGMGLRPDILTEELIGDTAGISTRTI